MPPEIVDAIAPLIAFISIGTMVLIGMKMRYQYKSSQLQQQKPEELERISDAITELYDQTRTLREEISSLEERLDFHERLLTRPREPLDTPAP